MEEADEPAGNNKPNDGARVELRSAEPAGRSRIQGYTLHILEDAFERYGIFVASHPFHVIAGCLALTLLCGGGLYWFRAENEGSSPSV
jgi:hypothetical protein